MFGKEKRYELNKIYHTAKGAIKFIKYIETPDGPKVEYLNLKTQQIETDFYGIVYYKISKYHKKLGILAPKAVKYEISVGLNRKLKFGVELELLVPCNISLYDKLLENGINVQTPNFTHQVVSGWKIVRDNSINETSNFNGYELVSPPSTNFDDLKVVCKVLKECKVKVDKSCGLHVHHDISELRRQQIIRIYNFYNKYENLINLMHNETRDNNHYCRGIHNIINMVNGCETKDELLKVIAGKGSCTYYSSHRYYKINLRSYLYYGTIEFRQAAGTINYDEIVDWILFTHKIIERGLRIGENIQCMDEETKVKYEQCPSHLYNEMMNELDIHEVTGQYKRLYKRIAKRTERIA